jgi:hypothetical protein
MGFWCALDINPEVEIPPQDFYTLYQHLRTEGLTAVFQMKGSAEVLLKQGLPDKQGKIIELIVQQCEIIQECWWYPENELKLNEEE